MVPIGTTPSEALRVAARSVPVVCVDRPQPDLGVDTILSDNAGGMRSAVEHLAAHRHERIGFLGDDQSIWTARERKSAFDSAAAALVLRGPLRSRVGPYAAGRWPACCGVDVRSGSGDGGGYRQQPTSP